MLRDGEKWACEACVRGHRVSNCHHTDRPLQHIAKKGRPVSQCHHCRTLRKTRAAHSKCDCGEKAHTKGACKAHGKEGEALKSDGCCCSHGGRCACSLKKEPQLDPVIESDSDEPSPCTASLPLERPKIHSTQSEGSSLTVFTNGHHKPAHKHNQMAHRCGLPYVVPRAHSSHGSSPGSQANRSVESLPAMSTIKPLLKTAVSNDPLPTVPLDHRVTKSEHDSPTAPSSNLEQLNGLLPQLDVGGFDGIADYNNYPVWNDGLPNLEFEQPIFSASATSVDWSHYPGLDFNSNNEFTTSEFSQAPSFTGFDFSSGGMDQAALTATSASGEISEAEDFGSYAAPSQTARPSLATQQFGSDHSDYNDADVCRFSAASSFIGMPQAQMLASNDIETLDIDTFLAGCTVQNSYVQPDNGSITMSSSFVDPSKYADINPFDDNGFQMPQYTDNDGLWMTDFNSSTTGLVMDSTSHAETDFDNYNVWAQ